MQYQVSDKGERRTGGVPGGLPADCQQPLRALIEDLNASGVRYCHWKSNIRLRESLRGDGDLDLLVHREDARIFETSLSCCGFKTAVSRGGLAHPGVFHAFALNDAATGLVHVHAYFCVVSGDSLVKTHRLSVEQDLLDGDHVMDGLPVPSPEAELAFFALRILLKSLHPIEVLMVSRGYDDVWTEINWLLQRADLQGASDLWRAWMPGTKSPALDAAVAVISEPRAWFRRLLLGVKIAAALRSRRRIGILAGERERWHRVVTLGIGHVLKRSDLVPRTGGLVVAIVGPKAVGKSTLGTELVRRLGRDLDVRRVHLGKPPPTFLSIPFWLLVPLARRIWRSERAGEYEKPERRREGRYSLVYVLRMVLAAHDRVALIRRCWKAAANGTIIVTDRYPSETPGTIDSSCFNDRAIADCRSPLKRWLMRREQSLYTGLARPDLVIRLTASPDTAVRRDALRKKEGGPDADAVLRRWRMETSAEFGDVPSVVVDTERTIDESAAELTRIVWAGI